MRSRVLHARQGAWSLGSISSIEGVESGLARREAADDVVIDSPRRAAHHSRSLIMAQMLKAGERDRLALAVR